MPHGESTVEMEETEEQNEDEQVIGITPVADEVIELQDDDDEDKSLSLPSTDIELPVLPGAETFHKDPSTSQQETTVRTEQTSSYTMQSRLGKTLEVVLGNTKETQHLDRKHCVLKQMADTKVSKSLYKVTEEDYKNILAPLQVKILAEQRKLKKEFDIWEKSYFREHNLATPSYDDIQSDMTASAIVKKLKYAKALLTNWNIKFS